MLMIKCRERPVDYGEQIKELEKRVEELEKSLEEYPLHHHHCPPTWYQWGDGNRIELLESGESPYPQPWQYD